MKSALHRIVVVGGGAGGLELVTALGKKLGKKGLVKPILLDGTPTHIWKPLLHEAATGRFNMGEDEVNYFSHSTTSGYEFQYGKMKGLDRQRKVIQVGELISESEGYKIAGPRELQYDTLVLAVGGVSNTFGIPGVIENCICLDSPKDADRLRRRLLNNALSVMLESSPVNKLRIGIVGGGATGVELAAEIHATLCRVKTYGTELFDEHVAITILEGGSKLLGFGCESMSEYATKELQKRNIEVKTNCSIKSVSENGFVLQDGTLINKDIKIWTAGIKAPDWLTSIGIQVNRSNRIIVDGNFQSVDDPCIFAIGDCACAPMSAEDPTKSLPASAQVAHQQAVWLTKKLQANLRNKSCAPFVFNNKGMLVSLGEKLAVGNVAGVVGPKKNYYVQGRGAKFLYESLYRMHQAELHGWMRVGLIVIADKFRHAALPELKLH